MSDIAVIIPFRDRGLDLRRSANLEIVMAWWYGHGFEPQIVDDGLEGDAPFNRHKAYNLAVASHPDKNTFVFTEADMLIHPHQIKTGIELAQRRPGLVVPFEQYRYLSDEGTQWLRDQYHDLPSDLLTDWWAKPAQDHRSVFGLQPESTMDGGRSIGAVNIVSRYTLEITGGFTEATHGNWYDDNIIEEAFAHLTGNGTRWVPGPAVHLYHLPGWKGDHLTAEDRAATARNKNILKLMRSDVLHGRVREVKELMEVRA